MKKIVYLACFLAIISAVAGGALAYVNSITAPVIEEMSIAAEKENLELIFPGAAFKEVEYKDETGLVKGMYEAEGQGYVFKIETYGYSSTPVLFMIAFDTNGETVGFNVLSHQETNGFGSRVFEEDYTNDVLGRTSADAYPLLSGATVTSTAVVKGIDAAKAIFNEMNGIEASETTTEPAKPELSLGNPVALDSDLERFDAQVEDQGDGIYLVSVKGYGLIEGDPDHGNYTRNEFEIKIDLETNEVIQVALITMGDTKGIGDKIDDEEYLSLFNGLSAENMSTEVDTISGATWSSKSVVAAVQAALNAAQGGSDE